MSQQVPTIDRTEAIKKLSAASRTLFLLGVLALFIGGLVFALAAQADYAVLSLIMIIVGGMYFFLGVMIRRRSIVALVIATVLVGLNLLASLLTIAPGGILFSIGVLSQLIPAVAAIKTLK